MCSQCQQPVVSGRGFGFVNFKIPGEKTYHFYHRFRPFKDGCRPGVIAVLEALAPKNKLKRFFKKTLRRKFADADACVSTRNPCEAWTGAFLLVIPVRRRLSCSMREDARWQRWRAAFR
jgi:hypothetical protein